MYDLLIRGGDIIDGTGAPAYPADVAIEGGRVAAIGPALSGEARETIDAAGKLVTPGFIDIHTHYDGQASWDDALLPSSAHGVTTIIIGSCGIGFAPVRKGQEDWLITLTEGVEDIPGAALAVGIPWGWESYTDYLDALERRTFALNIAAHVPHSSVRAYVMGKRAETDEPATEDEIAEIAGLVGDAIAAGAVGVGTSRVSMHRGSDGGLLPGTDAPEYELMAIARAVRDAGGGVFQIIPSGIAGGVKGKSEGTGLLSYLVDEHSLSDEIQMMRRIHRETGLPVTFTFGPSTMLGDAEFELSRRIIAEAAANGEALHPQFSPRSVGGLIALCTFHPFVARPSYQAIAHLPIAERARRMGEPAIKAAILSEADIEPESDDPQQHVHEKLQRAIKAIWPLGDNDYEPAPEDSVYETALRLGRDPFEYLYDLLLVDEGRNTLIRYATGYADGDLRKVAEFLDDPSYVMGLGDGGAHVRFICDANFPTFLLSHWGRDRTRGRIFPVEQLVHKLTGAPAALYGLEDRGEIALGKVADLNVIDFERLDIGKPHLVADLPTGAERFMQDAVGYDYTIVGGVVTRKRDVDTGARPGRLLRKRTAPDAPAEAPEQLVA